MQDLYFDRFRLAIDFVKIGKTAFRANFFYSFEGISIKLHTQVKCHHQVYICKRFVRISSVILELLPWPKDLEKMAEKVLLRELLLHF